MFLNNLKNRLQPHAVPIIDPLTDNNSNNLLSISNNEMPCPSSKNKNFILTS